MGDSSLRTVRDPTAMGYVNNKLQKKVEQKKTVQKKQNKKEGN